MPTEIEREQALLQQLRASPNPAAQREADHLHTLYHDRQMDGLAQDAYQAAKGEGLPPPGWTRLSEHPELLEKYAAQLHTSAFELKRTLRPDASGFRAEIYLPDASMQQAGYKPVLAFKGSSGEVMTSDGKRHDTTAEDFGANNFPQSVGLETDYYDRAMNLANLLKGYGVDFESTGHSLAGGMAAAAAAVTGTRATTFNAAGLNPVTAARFAQQHPGVVVSSELNQLITNYQVQGELLSDGVQNNIHNMDALRRGELGAVLKEACGVLRRVPEAREYFAQQLSAGLPPAAQDTVNAFVEKVATGDTERMLRELPLAVGTQHVLAPMTRDAHGRLVKREQVSSLPETTLLATPLLESLALASAGARMGERGGEVMAAVGHLEARGLHAAGGVDRAVDAAGAGVRAVTQTQGALLQAGEHVVGAALAHARTVQAEATALVDQGLGQARQLGAELDAAMLRGVGQLLPDQAQQALQAQAAWLEQAGSEAQRRGMAAAASDRNDGERDAATIRRTAQAVEAATLQGAEAFGAAQHAVIGSAGRHVRAELEATARDVENAARRAPSVLAATGAAMGLGVATALELTPGNYPRLAEAAAAVGQGKHAGTEAFERHLMASTVTPSLGAHVQSHERQARQILLHAPILSPPSAPGRAPSSGQPHADVGAAIRSPLRDFSDPSHPQNALYNTLKAELPSGTTPAWLTHATAACYMSGIRHPGDLGNIVGDGKKVMFDSNALLGGQAMIDTTLPAPAVQQTMQQVQRHDQQQMQVMSQVQLQGAQVGQHGMSL